MRRLSPKCKLLTIIAAKLLNPSGSGDLGQYFLVYSRGIDAFAVTASTTFGAFNVGTEIGVRHNMDMVASTTSNTVPAGTSPDLVRNPQNPVGDSLHYQASFVYLGEKTFLWNGLSAAGEIMGSHLLDLTQNASNFSPDRRHTSLGIRSVVTPSYYQVAPQLDISFPIGIGWNFQGRSPTEGSFNSGVFHGGDVSFGASFVYAGAWRGGLSYTTYISKVAVDSNGIPNDLLKDRDFISFNVVRSF